MTLKVTTEDTDKEDNHTETQRARRKDFESQKNIDGEEVFTW